VTGPQGGGEPAAPSLAEVGLTAAAAATVLALVQAQSSARAAITGQLVRQVQAIVSGFTGWYDDQASRRMATDIARLVATSQRLAASSTNGYLTQAATQMTGTLVRPAPAADLSGLRVGINPDEVYLRLANTYRYEMAKARAATIPTLPAAAPTSLHLPAPHTEQQVLDQVLTRAEVMADTDVTLAVRAQSQRFCEDTGRVTGYRRVIHPELSRTGTCGLCIAASDRVYRREALLPIHGRCNCEVLPIIDGIDPAGYHNGVDLRALYRDAGRTTAAWELKKVRYQVNDHGELGPTLGVKGQHFRDHHDLPEDPPHNLDQP
jgi:hypothetical protein